MDKFQLLSSLETKHGLPRGLLNAVMTQESGGNPNAVSPKGARGYFQFMPDTAKQYGVNPTDFESSASGAAKMYADLLQSHGGDLDKALASYNWGTGNVSRKGLDRAPLETKNYITKVKSGMGDNMNDAKPWEDFKQSSVDMPWEDFKPANKQVSPVEGNSFGENLLIGTGKGMTDLYLGAKQLAGLANESDVKQKRELDAPLMETSGGKIGSFAGQVAATAPAMLIPGVNTYAGAALFGAGTGAIQPTAEGESRALNTVLGGVGGVAGQKIGRVVGNAISNKVAKNALLKAQNATKDASLKAAQDVGLSIPRSLYNPTFTSNRVESFGGKAAVKQLARDENQSIVDNMVKKALGVSQDFSLDDDLLKSLRIQAAAPYKSAEQLSDEIIGKTATRSMSTGKIIQTDIVKNGSQLVNEINEARDVTRALWADSKSATGTARNAARAAAKSSELNLAVLEKQLDKIAVNQGQPQLVNQLSQARKQIAKIYTVDDALNKGTGSIDAAVFASKFQKGKPLDGDLKEIGRFAKTFKEIAPRGGSLSGAGISALEPMAGAMYGAAGSMAAGNPLGALAGGIPLLRGPARALALSKIMRLPPNYNGQILNLGNRLSPAYPYIGTGIGGLLGATSN